MGVICILHTKQRFVVFQFDHDELFIHFDELDQKRV